MLVIKPTKYFDAPMFSANIGKNPNVTPKVTNCNVIPTDDKSMSDLHLLALSSHAPTHHSPTE